MTSDDEARRMLALMIGDGLPISSITYAALILHLARNPGPHTVSASALAIGVSNSWMKRCAKVMERLRLAERAPLIGNRSAGTLTLRPAALRYLRAVERQTGDQLAA